MSQSQPSRSNGPRGETIGEQRERLEREMASVPGLAGWLLRRKMRKATRRHDQKRDEILTRTLHEEGDVRLETLEPKGFSEPGVVQAKWKKP